MISQTNYKVFSQSDYNSDFYLAAEIIYNLNMECMLLVNCYFGILLFWHIYLLLVAAVDAVLYCRYYILPVNFLERK